MSKKQGNFIVKRKAYIVTLSICIVIICILAVLLQNAYDNNDKLLHEDITGTYIYGNELDNAQYMAFYNDGTCIKYTQNQTRLKLTYKTYDNYYLLSNNNILVLKMDKLLLIDNNSVVTFEKKDDIPMVINRKK